MTTPAAIPARISLAQAALRSRGLGALLVPSADPHLSEYLPERWQGRQWLSGFTGSVGTLAVTADRAALFADSRYWSQAERELEGSGIELVKVPSAASSAHIDWLIEHTPRGKPVAVDGQVLGLAGARQLRGALERAGLSLSSEHDLLADIWQGRPGLPLAPIYAHRPPAATQPRSERLADLRRHMQRHGASHHLISTIDDLCWLLNLRGSDVSYNPVFLGHLLLDSRAGTLFVAPNKLPAELARELAQDGIQPADYAGARRALEALPKEAALLLDPRRVTAGLTEGLACRTIEAINPTTLAKARKNAAEAAQVRQVMEQDGAAQCRFYAWLEAALPGARLSELDIDRQLSAERAREPGFVGLSFATIAGFQANGALPHYRATPEHFAHIDGPGLLLIDSGGQYLGGTTDITRVWAIGRLPAETKRDCTLVLKGMLGLSRTRFPRGTLAPMLDSIARAPLWAQGIDYGHGTGHGVGYFLNVHEGPQSLSKAIPEAHMAMEPGMITSIEPGIYRPGRWGVRIENLVLNVPAPPGEFGEFLEFETLTLCPIDVQCLDLDLLDTSERAWLNAYHAEVRRRLAPRLEGAALEWLRRRTEAV
jgi:Xaa-Pro aminopeptidase